MALNVPWVVLTRDELHLSPIKCLHGLLKHLKMTIQNLDELL